MRNGGGYILTREKKAAMIANLKTTGVIAAAARVTGIERVTHYKWLKSDEDYKQAVQLAMEESTDALEAAALKRAFEGSDLLLIFMLKARRPHIYRDKFIDIQQNQSIQVNVTYADIQPPIDD